MKYATKPVNRIGMRLMGLGLFVSLLGLSALATAQATLWVADRLRGIQVAFETFPQGWALQWEGEAVSDGRGGLLADGKNILRIFDPEDQELGSYVGIFKAGYAQGPMRLILKDPKGQTVPGLSLAAIPGPADRSPADRVPGMGTSEPIQTGTLEKIERYRAPPFPVRLLDIRGKNVRIESTDTYDSRLKNNLPVPPSLTDCLLTDIWQRVTMDLRLLNLQPYQLSREQIDQALGIYLSRNWDQIAGFRPWVHWHFIRQLSPEERRTLSLEILRYVKTKRVWEEKK